jgi:hypothetical protein
MKGISYRPLSDMESNGVYFDKDELLLVGDDSLCQYSGLPSVESYMVKDDVKVPEEDKITYTL